jgi:hypothetical protein
VSKVKSTARLFDDATKFNQDIGSWDVSKVMYMVSMFEDASAFNQSIGSWDVSNATEMGSMLEGTSSINHVIGSWKCAWQCQRVLMFHDTSDYLARHQINPHFCNHDNLRGWLARGVTANGAARLSTKRFREDHA